jgi:4-diphosphocytidyl-2-C-methyl-D-erythritol kinase
VVLQSFAKLNLYLAVLRKRKDSYHNIETLFERISLCDTIIIKPRRDEKINIVCDNPAVPKDNSNLCYKSARLLRDNFKIKKGVDIKIIKRIPVGAGLGGGSSNAAAVLKGLNRLWQLALSKNELVDLAKRLGCDVPFFVYGTPFAYATERGDKIFPLKLEKGFKLWHIVAVPEIAVSTALIYRKWDEFCKLTKKRYNVNISVPKLLFNSLEAVTFRAYPQVEKIKEKMAGLGLKSILMSGSGPAVFGIVSSGKEAAAIARQLRMSGSLRVFVTRTF